MIARLVRMVVWFAVPLLALLAAGTASASDSSLVKLASARSPNLTRAERALLQFADIKNHSRGEFAFAGPSTVPNDPSNDPAHADQWDSERKVRAELIRWLCVDPDASRLVDPQGLRLFGARITGKLDLSHVHVPFGIGLNRCSIPERINLDSAQLPSLDLAGSYTGEIYGPSLVVDGDADIGYDGHEYGNEFHASGEVYLAGARVAGGLIFGGGSFRSSPQAPSGSGSPPSVSAVDVSNSTVKGVLQMCCGFESNGSVLLRSAAIGGELQVFGGHFINAGGMALDASTSSIGGNVLMMFVSTYLGGRFEADGLVSFLSAHVAGNFVVNQADFKGTAGKCGLDAGVIDVGKGLVWQHVDLQSGCQLLLAGATAQILVDDEQSWPKPGNLNIDDFTYNGLGPPNDARSRLRWLALQPPGFHPQRYRQLAKFLREAGDEPGAIEVLIAEEDARYMRFGFLGALWGGFLKWTIGYGHRPLLAIAWSLAVVLLGWGLVRTAERAGVMRPTWPENRPANFDRYERLSPFLYSIDVFVPFVNLHQEHYWWPDADAAGQLAIFGRKIRISGRWLRRYLWLQIIAGWMLSAIFVAGVTGLMRSD